VLPQHPPKLAKGSSHSPSWSMIPTGHPWQEEANLSWILHVFWLTKSPLSSPHETLNFKPVY
jgi:hypothetical protein